jgi:hypothetical protein
MNAEHHLRISTTDLDKIPTQVSALSLRHHHTKSPQPNTSTPSRQDGLGSRTTPSDNVSAVPLRCLGDESFPTRPELATRCIGRNSSPFACAQLTREGSHTARTPKLGTIAIEVSDPGTTSPCKTISTTCSSGGRSNTRPWKLGHHLPRTTIPPCRLG